MKQCRDRQGIRTDGADEELIGTLTAISMVSRRLARKLTALSCQQEQLVYKRPASAERRHHASLRD